MFTVLAPSREDPRTKIQDPNKHQTPNFNRKWRIARQARGWVRLELEFWNFSGAWMLELGNFIFSDLVGGVFGGLFRLRIDDGGGGRSRGDSPRLAGHGNPGDRARVEGSDRGYAEFGMRSAESCRAGTKGQDAKLRARRRDRERPRRAEDCPSCQGSESRAVSWGLAISCGRDRRAEDAVADVDGAAGDLDVDLRDSGGVEVQRVEA